MALPEEIYIGDGVTDEFDITFPFLEKAHVDIFVNSIPVGALMRWVSPTRIKLTTIPQTGDRIWIKRSTPTDPLLEYHAGAMLKPEDLELAYKQNLYILQELFALYNGALKDGLKNIADGTAIDWTTADEVLNALTQRLLEVDAADQLRQRISDIDLNAEDIISQAAQISTINDDVTGQSVQLVDHAKQILEAKTGVQENAAAVESAKEELSTALESEAKRIEAVIANLANETSDNTAGIIEETKARTEALKAQSIQFSKLFAKVDTDMADLSANIQSEAEARVEADQAAAARVNTLVAQLQTDIGTNVAAIIDAQKARADGDEAEADARRLLATKVGDNEAALQQEVSARSDADEAILTDLSILGVKSSDGKSWYLDETKVHVFNKEGDTTEAIGKRLKGFDTIIEGVSSTVADEINTRASEDQALANQITELDTTLTADLTAKGTAIELLESDLSNTNDGLTSLNLKITNVESSLSDTDGKVAGNASVISGLSSRVTSAEGRITSQASSLTNLSSSVGSLSSSVSQYGNAINGIESEWGVRLNSNGHVIGVQLINSSSTKEFVVQADKFKVVTPYGGGYKTPFIVSGSQTYIDGAIIQDGTITADALNVTSLSAVSANMGTVTGGLFQTKSPTSSSIRAAIGSSQYPFWVGRGSAHNHNSANRVFSVDNNGNGYFAGTLNVDKLQGNAFTVNKSFKGSNWTNMNTGSTYQEKQRISGIQLKKGGVQISLSATMVNEAGDKGFLNVQLEYRSSGGAWRSVCLWEKLYWMNVGDMRRANVPLTMVYTFNKGALSEGKYDFRFTVRGEPSFVVREPYMCIFNTYR